MHVHGTKRMAFRKIGFDTNFTAFLKRIMWFLSKDADDFITNSEEYSFCMEGC